VSGDLPTTGYDPIAVEAAHYDWWQKKGFFKPVFQTNGEPLPKGTFCITFPPPNVTGNLHIGHALTVSLEDALVRWSVSVLHFDRKLTRSLQETNARLHRAISTRL
jgi:valyl-tRNA synthetase